MKVTPYSPIIIQVSLFLFRCNSKLCYTAPEWKLV